MNQNKNFSVKVDNFKSVEIDLNEPFDLVKKQDGGYSLIHDSKTYDIELLSVDINNKSVELSLNGVFHKCIVSKELDILIKKLGLSASSGSVLKEIKAPMPGKVIDILVNTGQDVKKGDSLLILEAMKMENVIKAPHDLMIKDIKVAKNQAVDKGEVLIKL